MISQWPKDHGLKDASATVRRMAVVAMDRWRSDHDSWAVLMVQAWTCSTVRLSALYLEKEAVAETSLCAGSSIANTVDALASGTADVRATETASSLKRNVRASV